MTNEKKTEITKTVIGKYFNSQTKAEADRLIRELLINETNGGKLYKYRSFDKNGYSLGSVQSGALHCSKPSVFNDPFDCKFSVSVISMLKEANAEEWDILKKFLSVVSGESDLSKYTSDEQEKLKKLLDNQQLMTSVMKNVENFANESNKQENNHPIADMYQELLSNTDVFPHLSVYSSTLSTVEEYLMSQNPSFSGSNDITDVMSELLALDDKNSFDEVDSLIDFCSKVENGHENDESELREGFQKMSHIMDEHIMIGCLSSDFNNRLMWSHYGDSYRGFCIEYDFSKLTSEDDLRLVLPVIYSDERPDFPWEILHNPKDQNKIMEKIVLGLLAKDEIWAYENEWRVIISASEDPDIKMPPISCIYIGNNISDENRQKIILIASAYDIPVKQISLSNNSYNVQAKKIN